MLWNFIEYVKNTKWTSILSCKAKTLYEHTSYKDEAAQDKSDFCIFHIMNEIFLHPEMIFKFLDGNHSHNF